MSRPEILREAEFAARDLYIPDAGSAWAPVDLIAAEAEPEQHPVSADCCTPASASSSPAKRNH
jgi:hypothetical protein